jgi:hypothetical protein
MKFIDFNVLAERTKPPSLLVIQERAISAEGVV